jgi:hypothetical protein
MKRSEMIKILATGIDKCSLPGEWPHKVSKDAAEELLSLLELNGMLPPGIYDERCHPHNEYLYEWEKEDEEV